MLDYDNRENRKPSKKQASLHKKTIVIPMLHLQCHTWSLQTCISMYVSEASATHVWSHWMAKCCSARYRQALWQSSLVGCQTLPTQV